MRMRELRKQQLDTSKEIYKANTTSDADCGCPAAKCSLFGWEKY